MNEELFWQLIDKARSAPNANFETQCVTLTEYLLAYTEEEIITFEEILREKIEEASSWRTMAASFVVRSFISDDEYEDFRAWLVGQGKTNFHKVLRDPNEICNILKPGQVKDMHGEYMLFVAVNAYLEKTDSDDDEAFYEKIEHPEEKEIVQTWPESKQEYRNLFPRLYDTFWNEKRIEERLEEAENEE
ncbi:MAG: DUF4240 domain-containing protein [Edaphocola sp.]